MEEKSNLNIAIIIGSTRPGRYSEKPAKWIHETTAKREAINVELLDLRDYPLPFLGDEKSEGNSKEVLNKWSGDISKADAYIIISPEYNHSFPAVLKNALDYLYKEWNNKPVGFVSYGSVAGARSIEQLRLVAIELSMAPIRDAIHIPQFKSALDNEGNINPDFVTNSRGNTLAEMAEKFLDQLIWWGKALKKARQGKG
jgi:NAD(P)H-dependent FMN reductase